MEIEAFAFFRSYYDCGKKLPARIRHELYDAICEYAFEGREPALSDGTKPFWILIKPTLDANKRSRENGAKGGRPKKGGSEKEKTPLSENEETTLSENEKPIGKDRKGKDISIAADAAGLGDDTKPRKEADAFAALAGEDEELLSALRDFEQMRNRIKKPMTARAKRLLCAKLQKSFDPADWVAVLEQSITACWADVYELKQAEKPAQPAEKWEDLW